MVDRALLARQKLLACDVDGVLTDGGITYATGNIETKEFSIKDGLGIRLMNICQFPVVWVAKRMSDAVTRRAAELNVVAYQGTANKEAVLRRIAEERGITLEEITYIGDDVDDLPALRVAGVPIAVADAVKVVRDAAVYVTEIPGGYGAVREVIELLLDAQGRLDEAMERYLANIMR
jgi:3-deoxy-D-manno-octulosonate 8-phosphate phosphatase (KDO 8-P phosphatase)